MKYVALLLSLVICIVQVILIVVWKMLSLHGIFIAINVLDIITNFGQGSSR